MKLIAGLGNPGREYEKTRHNAGFMTMDLLLDQLNVSLNTEKWKAKIAKVRVGSETVLLMKPLTYMNESGKAIVQAVNYYHIEDEDILIIHDDMDLPPGNVRIRKNGSSGGQKGMQSIIDHLGTKEIARIRIGVGHSRRGNHEIVPDWVLSPIPKAEKELFETALKDAALAAEAWITQPMEIVMSRYNLKVKPIKEEPVSQ